MDQIYNYPPQQPTIPQPRKKSSVLFIALTLLLLIASAGGASAYFFYFNNPQIILQNSLEAMSKVQSFASNGELKVKLNQKSIIPLSAQNNLLGIFQQIESVSAQNISSSLSFAFNTQYDASIPSEVKVRSRVRLNFSSAEGQSMSVAGESRIIGNYLYLLLGELKYPNFNEMVPFDYGEYVKPYLNKWIAIESNQVADNASLLTGSSSLIGLKNYDANSYYEKFNPIIEKYRAKIFVLKNYNQKYQLNNHNVESYPWTLDKAQVREFFLEIVQAYLPEEPLKSEDIASFDKFFADFDMPVGQLDIDRTTNFITKMTLNHQFSDPTTKQQMYELNLTVNLEKFNENFKIQAPTSSKTFEQLFQEVSSYYMSNPDLAPNPPAIVAKSRDSQRLSDISTLRKAIDASIALGDIETLPVCKGSITITKCTSLDQTASNWLPIDLNKFLAQQPSDPINGKTITTASGKTAQAGYYFRSDGNEFKLATYLEDPSNLDRATNDGGTQPDMFETGSNVSNKFGI